MHVAQHLANIRYDRFTEYRYVVVLRNIEEVQVEYFAINRQNKSVYSC